MMMMMMMMKILLLFIMLTSCVSGTFVVNVTQSSYQAEENQDITLEWTFTTNNHTSSNPLNIFCELITDRPSVLFYLHEGVEVPESQDEQFAGRVQWDKDVLREGRLRLHVSRLRTEDSGLYVCKVKSDYGLSSGKCWLNVSGEHRLTCPQTIEAAEGDDVIIQCGLDPPVDLSDYTLDVARLDLGDDDGDVYCYRRGKDQQDDQMDRYRDRTTLNHEDLIRGIVTLKISSVTLSDSGPYKVYVPDLRASFIINITVGSAKEELFWIIVLGCVCGVFGGAVGTVVGVAVHLLLVKRGVIRKKM